ncbi:MAG TPA: hypothetical protein VKD67_12115 [Acidimicrobiales bacterium]|nr:hypothetical protein [Acidimicrobiales bacterium]
MAEPVMIDPGDYDAVGVMADVVLTLRRHAMERQADVVATVSAPPGRHRLLVTARPSGHTVFSVRFDELTKSRRNAIAAALTQRAWDFDDDGEGATHRYPPGTEHTTVAFDALPLLTLGGVPADRRTITALDASGQPVDL